MTGVFVRLMPEYSRLFVPFVTVTVVYLLIGDCKLLCPLRVILSRQTTA